MRLAALGLVLVLALVLVTGWTAFGKRAQGFRQARVAASPE